jgi:hypothetical protein
MPTTDVDPNVQEADERASRAKESLLSRVEELKQRFAEVRHRFDPREQIAGHPIPAVGLAFALGVIAALGRQRGAGPGEARSSLVGAAFAGLATVGLRIVREAAMAQLGRSAHDWWSSRDAAARAQGGAGTPDAEPFLEH